MNSRNRGGVQKGVRDYIVPIIGLLLFVLVIFNVFKSDESAVKVAELENKIGLNVSLEGNNSESFIYYPGDHKEKIVGNTMLYKGEKVIVKKGTLSLSLSGLGDFKLNKLGDFKYLEGGQFYLYSGELWFNSNKSTVVKMKFGTITVGENSNIAFSQNEMGSTVYLLNGFAEISSLAGESTVLASGQKITISRLDASKEELDLSLLKENIDDYYKQSDWFILNNGSNYLVDDESEGEETGTGMTSKLGSDKLITFSNLFDESNVSTDSIIVAGNFIDENITKIILNGKEASLDTELKTFKFENVLVNKKENDLVFKIYDDANDLISKFVYVIYYNGASAQKKIYGNFKVQTFNVDGSKFTFSSIKDGALKQLNGKTSYTTYGDFLTIYGNVLEKNIAKVEVDGYTLKSFNGKSWRYHPSVQNNNLNIGTNVYTIKYFDKESTLLYTNYFTIIKKIIKAKTYSAETKVN